MQHEDTDSEPITTHEAGFVTIRIGRNNVWLKKYIYKATSYLKTKILRIKIIDWVFNNSRTVVVIFRVGKYS